MRRYWVIVKDYIIAYMPEILYKPIRWYAGWKVRNLDDACDFCPLCRKSDGKPPLSSAVRIAGK